MSQEEQSKLVEKESNLFRGVAEDGSVEEFQRQRYSFIGKVEGQAPLFDLWVCLSEYRSVLIAQSAWYVSESRIDNFDFSWSIIVNKNKIDKLIELLELAKERLK